MYGWYCADWGRLQFLVYRVREPLSRSWRCKAVHVSFYLKFCNFKLICILVILSICRLIAVQNLFMRRLPRVGSSRCVLSYVFCPVSYVLCHSQIIFHFVVRLFMYFYVLWPVITVRWWSCPFRFWHDLVIYTFSLVPVCHRGSAIVMHSRSPRTCCILCK